MSDFNGLRGAPVGFGRNRVVTRYDVNGVALQAKADVSFVQCIRASQNPAVVATCNLSRGIATSLGRCASGSSPFGPARQTQSRPARPFDQRPQSRGRTARKYRFDLPMIFALLRRRLRPPRTLEGPRLDRALSRALRSGRREIDAEALIRAMVFNRLCAPDSKLGCLRWLETVAMPAMPEGVTHQHLLRAMDALMDHAEVVEIELARRSAPSWIRIWRLSS